MWMEWQQLEYFQMVARMEHVTRAAEQLKISQPALSRSIAKLEEELGVPLFQRQGRTLSLNRYGEMFLKRVNRAIQEITDGKQELQDLLNPSHGTVSLAFLHTLGTNVVPDLIGSFRTVFPQVNFQLYQNNTHAILDQLERGDIDFCLSSPTVTRPGIRWLHLFTEELFVFVPNDHPMADRESIDLHEMSEEPFILLKPGYGLRSISDRLCAEAGFTPRATFEGEEVATVAGLVAAKLGVAILPDVVGVDKTKLAKVRVRTPSCRREIALAWLEGRYMTPVAKRFQEFVVDHYGI
jgi:DNA-binding transcriptional LysR family regulator